MEWHLRFTSSEQGSGSFWWLAWRATSDTIPKPPLLTSSSLINGRMISECSDRWSDLFENIGTAYSHCILKNFVLPMIDSRAASEKGSLWLSWLFWNWSCSMNLEIRGTLPKTTRIANILHSPLRIVSTVSFRWYVARPQSQRVSWTTSLIIRLHNARWGT